MVSNYRWTWAWSELDESTACRQLKSPRSLSGRSIVPYTWPWSPNGHGHEWPTATPFVQCPSALPFWYSYFKIWPWKSRVKVMCVVKGQGHVWPSKFKGQGYGQGQTWWSHLSPRVQSICLLFASWQSDHFWLRYSKFYIWPWKFKVKVMAKVKPNGHIWALEFNRYVCFSFRGNQTIFGWDIANSIFDLEKSRSRSRRKLNQVIYRSGPTIMPNIEIRKVVQKLSREQESADCADAPTGTKT